MAPVYEQHGPTLGTWFVYWGPSPRGTKMSINK